MTLIRNAVRYQCGITNERNYEGRNSVFVRYSVQEPVRGELWFAANISSPGANVFAVANCYAYFQENFGELVHQILRSPRTQFPADSFAANACQKWM